MFSVQRGHSNGVAAVDVKEVAGDVISKWRSCSRETHPSRASKLPQASAAGFCVLCNNVLYYLSFSEVGLSCSYKSSDFVVHTHASSKPENQGRESPVEERKRGYSSKQLLTIVKGRGSFFFGVCRR
jgi:hypothetical protein